jgi:hypothetical protein
MGLFVIGIGLICPRISIAATAIELQGTELKVVATTNDVMRAVVRGDNTILLAHSNLSGSVTLPPFKAIVNSANLVSDFSGGIDFEASGGAEPVDDGPVFVSGKNISIVYALLREANGHYKLSYIARETRGDKAIVDPKVDESGAIVDGNTGEKIFCRGCPGTKVYILEDSGLTAGSPTWVDRIAIPL